MTHPRRATGVAAVGALLTATLAVLTPRVAAQLPEPATGRAVFGDAAFLPGVTTAVLAADLNADGLDDIVTGTFGVSVGLNNGFGAFRLLTNLEAGVDPQFRHFLGTDLDGDGYRDVLASSDAHGGRVWFFRGDGTGALALASTRVVPGAAHLDVADFDQDGLLDVVVGHDAAGVDFHILRGLTGGSLGAPTPFGSTPVPTPWVAAGDWSLDGAPDVFVARVSSIDYWVNDGTGALTESFADFDQLGVRGPMRFADVDADGVPELLHAVNTPHIGMALQESDGLGGFGGSKAWDLDGFGAQPVESIDVQRAPLDGFPDVVFAGGGRVVVLDNETGELALRTNLDGSDVVSAGDFDGDGNLDVLEQVSKGARVRYRLQGDTFSEQVVSELDDGPGGVSWPIRIVAAQLDGDPSPEFVIANRGTASLHVAEVGPGPSLQITDSFAALNPLASYLELADVDGVATLDLVVGHDGPTGVAWISVHRGDGFGGFSTPVNTEVGGRLVGLADLDLDGRLDAVSFTGSTSFGFRVTTWLGDGSGSFTEGGDLPLLDAQHHAACLGDLTGDGVPDLVLTLHDTSLPGGALLAVHPGDGAGGWNAPLDAPPAVPLWNTPAVGDFDGDGDLDVVSPTSGGETGRVALYLNDGDGQLAFSLTAGFLTTIPNGLLVADVDQDGKLDVAHGTTGDDAVVVLRGNGAGGFETPVAHAGLWASDPGTLLSVDVDLDGKRDLVQLAITEASHHVQVLRREGFAGEAWAAVGGGVPGGAGQPTGLASGFPKFGKLIALRVTRAPPLTNGFFVVGIDTLQLGFKGGYMVPRLDLVFLLPKTSAAGEITLEYAWGLDLPTDLDVWMQVWFPDPTAYRGFAATGGYRLRVP